MAVATINPYAGGAVVFNEQPWLSYYERQMARQQAKSDAMDNYFRDLNKNITSAGMRSQDVPGLLQKNNDWQQFYAQNKAAITNPKLDGGRAYTQYQAMYQDQLGHINESKEALKTMDEIGKLRLNPQTSYVADDPNFFDQVHKHDLPIGDPNRQSINLAEITLPPKPIGVKEKADFDKYVIGNAKPDEVRGRPIQLGGFQTQIPITSQYGESSLRSFGSRAADAYDTDKSWRNYANQIYKETITDPVKHTQLDDIHKRYYGTPIDNPRDAFIAQTIADHDTRSIKYEKGEDKWGLAQAEAGMKFNYALRELKAKQKMKDKSAAQQDSVIDDLYDEIKADAQKSLVIGRGSLARTYEMKPSGEVLKMFAVKDDKGHDIYPDRVRFSNDFKQVIPIFYARDNDGNLKKDKQTGQVEVLKELSYPILESEFKQRWKKGIMGAGAYGKELSKGGKEQESDNKTTSTSDWRSRAIKVQ
jgi:hypothetical protein